MKLNFGRKLVLFLHWLMSLAFCALAVLQCAQTDAANAAVLALDNAFLAVFAGWGKIVGIAVLAVYLLLCVLVIVFIFSGKKKRADRNFITVDNSEAGRTRIAIAAVEQMIRQAVRGVDGIAEMKSSITNNEDSISINSSVTIASGNHVPTVTMNIQRAVRSYIELNCGVAVREVCVSVNALEGDETGKKRGRGANVPAPAAVNAYEPVQAPVIESIPAEQPEAETSPEVPAEEVPVQEETETQASE